VLALAVNVLHAGTRQQLQQEIQLMQQKSHPYRLRLCVPDFVRCTSILLTCLEAATRRRNAFFKANVPNLDATSDARVSTVRPIQVGDYVFVFKDESAWIMLGKGILIESNLSPHF